MDLGLQGRRALVTGASQGLGFAVARLLALEGCHVTLSSRNPQRLSQAVQRIQEETQTPVHYVVGDVSQAQDPERIVRESAEHMGGLDVLITNAGGPPPGSFEAFTDADWYRAFDLCFMMHVRLIRAALPFLRQSAVPSVLTITSISAKQPVEHLILSNTMRAAAVALTKSLALELGSEGIRFNSILPTWTRTERVSELLRHRAQVKGTTLDEEIAAQAQASPLGRMAEPEEFARVAVFLVSPAASYMTGAAITVDGGMYKGLF